MKRFLITALIFAAHAVPCAAQGADDAEKEMECMPIVAKGPGDPRFQECFELMTRLQNERIEWMEKPDHVKRAESFKPGGMMEGSGLHDGWPPPEAFARYGFVIREPALGVPVYFTWTTEENAAEADGGGALLRIAIEKQYDMPAAMRAGTHKLGDEQMPAAGFDALRRHLEGSGIGERAQNEKNAWFARDPKKRDTPTDRYRIKTSLNAFTITIYPVSFHSGGGK